MVRLTVRVAVLPLMLRATLKPDTVVVPSLAMSSAEPLKLSLSPVKTLVTVRVRLVMSWLDS